jgi:hypothetical protein
MADLRFRSGLRLMVTAISPHEWEHNISEQMKVTPESMKSVFGQDTMQSDYSFIKALYEFTPAQMHHWSSSQRARARDQWLLIIKSLALLKSAESGIFILQNQGNQGFQEGNPLTRQDVIAVHLFSENGSAEIIFFQKDYKNSTGITQPEINRIVQSLHKTSQ